MVQKGEAWVAIAIGENFTVDLHDRVTDVPTGRTPSPAVVKGSTIELFMDVTSTSMVYSCV